MHATIHTCTITLHQSISTQLDAHECAHRYTLARRHSARTQPRFHTRAYSRTLPSTHTAADRAGRTSAVAQVRTHPVRCGHSAAYSPTLTHAGSSAPAPVPAEAAGTLEAQAHQLRPQSRVQISGPAGKGGLHLAESISHAGLTLLSPLPACRHPVLPEAAVATGPNSQLAGPGPSRDSGIRAKCPGTGTHRPDAVREAGRRRLRLRFAEEAVHGAALVSVPTTATATAATPTRKPTAQPNPSPPQSGRKAAAAGGRRQQLYGSSSRTAAAAVRRQPGTSSASAAVSTAGSWRGGTAEL